PVGVAIDGTGALLVADDAGNTVWRVAAADGSVTPEPIASDRVASGGTDGITLTPLFSETPSDEAASMAPPQMEIAPAVLQEGAGREPPAQQSE
ncbi:MAG: sorbosone dehydrogenase family protein, partial [Pseudaminobacter sp.]|nr:sorbosone dehydrogenase family protein [Pseudaminobacter sp.]